MEKEEREGERGEIGRGKATLSCELTHDHQNHHHDHVA